MKLTNLFFLAEAHYVHSLQQLSIQLSVILTRYWHIAERQVSIVANILDQTFLYNSNTVYVVIQRTNQLWQKMFITLTR